MTSEDLMIYTVEQVAEALGVSRASIDKRISRGHFGTDHKPAPGLGRKWTTGDVVRLRTALLLPIFVPDGLAGSFADLADYEFPPNLFLVAFPMTPPIGAWRAETVKRADIASFFENRKLPNVVVIDLDQVVLDVKERLSRVVARNG